MPNTIELVKNALSKLEQGILRKRVQGLLDAMGYGSDLTGDDFNSPKNFCKIFPARRLQTKAEKFFCNAVHRISIICQITDAEIKRTLKNAVRDQPFFSKQEHLGYQQQRFDQGRQKSFVFVGIDLEPGGYTRSDYAQMTREVSKRFAMPVGVLFRHNGKATFAFAARRPSQRSGEENRDVLGRISLAFEIDLQNTHRAHLEILKDLSLPSQLRWIKQNDKECNFDGLLEAWTARLDIKVLNKRFYQDLFAWFQAACHEARFPPGTKKNPVDIETQIIRLITRILFIWFIKQKGLVAEELFIEEQVRRLLKNRDLRSDDDYYRAILQNLFFATLNTEISKRRFSTGDRRSHRDAGCYRYLDLLADKEKFLLLMNQSPFINGGLFDCLDPEEAGKPKERIDCFSDNPNHRKFLSVPNSLFFGHQRDFLDEEGNEQEFTPLFSLLESYKFTVEENTPIEHEVALDPELLGQVFENLLAAHNPETRENVRKQTGSYYTPREIVDYMVDESLATLLLSKLNFDKKDLSKQLQDLFSFEVEEHDFNQGESKQLVAAIAKIYVLDPAVGSGAFPMGVLHKLELALKKLDPDNKVWKEIQRGLAIQQSGEAFMDDSRSSRDERLDEISETFERCSSSFGRKLYLIQNSIFGVDVQPIACQIAKLRFFISLVIEQKPNQNQQKNYGIKPLPNLETRFVAANTLLGFGGKGIQLELMSQRTQPLMNKLREIRRRHFNARDRQQKLLLSAQDKKIREELADELACCRGITNKEAAKIAQWDLYNQNTGADWFDAEWMFGCSNDFDVVIGNPPYVRAEGKGKYKELRKKIAESRQYSTLFDKWDLFIPFIELGFNLLGKNGIISFIVSNAYCRSKYARKSRKYFLENSRILCLDFYEQIKIFEAAIKNVSFVFQKAEIAENKPLRRLHQSSFGNVEFLETDKQPKLDERIFAPQAIKPFAFDGLSGVVPLNKICYISYGLRASSKANDRGIHFTTEDVISNQKTKIHTKPFVRGKHIAKWHTAKHIFIEWERTFELFYARTFDELYDVREKLIALRSPGASPKTCYDVKQLRYDASSVGFVPWHYLSHVRNRSIRKTAQYRNEGLVQRKLSREECEEISRRFSPKFLLGTMNSTFARACLRSRRRSNIHIYPDDWKSLPIPDVAREKQRPVIRLVNQILKNPQSHKVSDYEDQIDKLVFSLYKLSAKEIALIKSID